MAQVQPDSNMSDICYYSEISFFCRCFWMVGVLVRRAGRGSLVDRPPCCIQVDPEKQQFFRLYSQTDESGDAWIIWGREIATSHSFFHRCWKWYSQLSKKYRSYRQHDGETVKGGQRKEGGGSDKCWEARRWRWIGWGGAQKGEGGRVNSVAAVHRGVVITQPCSQAFKAQTSLLLSA